MSKYLVLEWSNIKACLSTDSVRVLESMVRTVGDWCAKQGMVVPNYFVIAEGTPQYAMIAKSMAVETLDQLRDYLADLGWTLLQRKVGGGRSLWAAPKNHDAKIDLRHIHVLQILDADKYKIRVGNLDYLLTFAVAL